MKGKWQIKRQKYGLWKHKNGLNTMVDQSTTSSGNHYSWFKKVPWSINQLLHQEIILPGLRKTNSLKFDEII
jgi:hypothetical protein